MFADVLLYLGLGLAVLQGSVGIGFVLRLYLSRREIAASDADSPRALIVLCVRGTDPFLDRCLRGLLRQAYSRFEVCVVVDRRDDPAWQVVQNVIDERAVENVRIEELRDRRTTCSLKCSALLQAWEGAEERYDVVALIDADVVPHDTWLAELVAGLHDPRVGAVCGNRWYMPRDPTWGATTRYLWNAGAVVPMYWHAIGWGGTTAFKTSVLQQTTYRDRIGRALCEDTMLRSVLREAGLRLKFIPGLMMINREDCSLGDFYRWMRRQMLVARLYHPDAMAIIAHGIMAGTYVVVAIATVIVATALGREALTVAAAWGLAAHLGSLLGVLPFLEMAVRRIARRRGETVPPFPLRAVRMSLLLIPMLQAAYAVAVTTLLRPRSVEWRGIHYRIDGPLQIRRLNDEVYSSDESSTAAIRSL